MKIFKCLLVHLACLVLMIYVACAGTVMGWYVLGLRGWPMMLFGLCVAFCGAAPYILVSWHERQNWIKHTTWTGRSPC